jgi:hypothetical protein
VWKANHSNRRIGARTGANQTVPYGTALLRSLEVALSQALRARLRSDRPSGTGGKASSASGATPSTWHRLVVVRRRDWCPFELAIKHGRGRKKSAPMHSPSYL